MNTTNDINQNDEPDYHEMLMAYGKVCQKQGLLSDRAVQIRMDLATMYLDKPTKAQLAQAEVRGQCKTWWVTNHDAPEDSKRVAGPFTTASDAGICREILELKTNTNINYWIEELKATQAALDGEQSQ